jgi:threonine dehydrogenase-like Zn-dependent dehydrogenase
MEIPMLKEARRVGDQMIWHEYQEPVLAPGQVRIGSQFSAPKHGTEIAFWHGGHGKRRGPYDKVHQVFVKDKAPEVLAAPAAQPAGQAPKPAGPPGSGVGNMTVGAVVEVGPDVRMLAMGDRVLTYGGFRQTHVRPERACWKIPAEMPWQSAVCLDPADFAMGAIRDGHVRVGDAVAVFGLGAIGLMVVQIAKVAGASPIIAVDPLPTRRNLAVRLGADLALDPAACDAGLEIKKATDRRGADVVIDYSGSVQAMQAALRGVAYGGTVVAGAFPPPYPAGLDLGAEAHLNVPNFVFTRSCSEPNRDYPRWDERRIFAVCLRMLQAGTISGVQVVTPIVRFEDALTEYPKIATKPDTYIKLGVAY